MSDHFTISAQVSHNLANGQNDPPCAKYRNFKTLKGKKTLNFFFLLDQKLKKLPEHTITNDYMNALAKTILESAVIFVPEKRVENSKKDDMETWITNETEIAIVRQNPLFEKWIQNLTRTIATNTELYKIRLPN